MAKTTDKDESLKRLGGGRWQTRDERFTIEPQSGTWVVVDAEQTDELGLALVRGPFGSLGDAKLAITAARDSEPAASPLDARAAKLQRGPSTASGRGGDGSGKKRAASASKAKPEEPTEPKWLLDLEPAGRRRARQLIERLTEAGAKDPEGITRRDVVGDVPAASAFALARVLERLADDASPVEVARLLAQGRDADLGVGWRLVDEEDRPITLDLDARKRR